MIQVRHIFVLLLIPTLACIQLACSSVEEAPLATGGVLGAIDSRLVGDWTGTIDGSMGPADLLLELSSEGFISAEVSMNLYCPFTGSWGLRNNKFSASGTDECDGTRLSLSAPFSMDSLIGTWNAASGYSGSFAVGRN
ncbi:MAG: hypothetical protein OEQ53_09315 [Saprospiraceae bacterium]|nr:hypothetical protein [Saprospiraceae bacterium]